MIGKKGKGRPPGTTPEQAERELCAAGYEPLEPYPGIVLAPWRVRCTECDLESSITLNYIHRGRRCLHRDPDSIRVPAEVAEEELRSAGYRPLEPYPGSAGAPWPAICLTCGSHRRPTLSKIRQERRCGHLNI